MGSYDNVPAIAAGHVVTDAEWAIITALLAASYTDGGLLSERFAYKQTDTTYAVSSTTMQNDPDMTIPLTINSTTVVEGMINYAGAATPQIKVGWTVPTGCGIRWSSYALDPSVTASAVGGQDTAVRSASTPTLGVSGIGTKVSFGFKMTLTMSTSPGSLQLQAAQAVSNAANGPIIGAGSYLIVKRIM